MKTEVASGVRRSQVKGAQSPRSWKRQEGSPDPTELLTSGGSPALPTPCFQTSSLQNGERINFYCFKPLVVVICYRRVQKLPSFIY